MITEVKACSRCGISKPIECFHSIGNGKKRADCDLCRSNRVFELSGHERTIRHYKKGNGRSKSRRSGIDCVKCGGRVSHGTKYRTCRNCLLLELNEAFGGLAWREACNRMKKTSERARRKQQGGWDRKMSSIANAYRNDTRSNGKTHCHSDKRRSEAWTWKDRLECLANNARPSRTISDVWMRVMQTKAGNWRKKAPLSSATGRKEVIRVERDCATIAAFAAAAALQMRLEWS